MINTLLQSFEILQILMVNNRSGLLLLQDVMCFLQNRIGPSSSFMSKEAIDISGRRL